MARVKYILTYVSCSVKEQADELETQDIFKISGLEHQTICAQTKGHDPLPTLGTVFTLPRNEER